MGNKKLFFILVSFMSTIWTPVLAQTCPRCNGHGQIKIESPSVSTFGVSRKVGDCGICGHAIFQGEAHRHTICPSCNGTGRKSGTMDGRSSYGESSAKGYDPRLTPEEYFRVEELGKLLFTGKTETRRCNTCGGTGRCPGAGYHHYGNMVGDILDLNSPMPAYCPLCNGWGNCPNRNCVNGVESYTRPLTESEKNEINREIKSIYENAYKR